MGEWLSPSYTTGITGTYNMISPYKTRTREEHFRRLKTFCPGVHWASLKPSIYSSFHSPENEHPRQHVFFGCKLMGCIGTCVKPNWFAKWTCFSDVFLIFGRMLAGLAYCRACQTGMICYMASLVCPMHFRFLVVLAGWTHISARQIGMISKWACFFRRFSIFDRVLMGWATIGCVSIC